jgi:hypothetical protein
LKSLAVAVLIVAALVGCGADDDDRGGGDSFVADIRPAIEAVEAELGAGQEFFEVTANELVTNLFVAVDDATAAVPYVFLDGELQPPAPKLTGASGFTFSADAVDFDEDTILDAVGDELPESTIEALSIEGGEGGVVRYVVSTLSPEGGRLDVTVAPDGTVLAVDPL